MSRRPPGVRLRHLALVVRSLDTAELLYARTLGLPSAGRAELSGEGVRASFVPVGGSQIELLEPLGPQGAIGRFLSLRGEAIHHLALEVTDLEEALARARRAGLRLVDAMPRPGAHGTRIAFVHPGSTCGVLVEFVEPGPVK